MGVMLLAANLVLAFGMAGDPPVARQVLQRIRQRFGCYIQRLVAEVLRRLCGKGGVDDG